MPIFIRATLGLADLLRIHEALGSALMVCWIEGGAQIFFLAFWRGGAVELPGRSRPAPGVALTTFALVTVSLYPLLAPTCAAPNDTCMPAAIPF